MSILLLLFAVLLSLQFATVQTYLSQKVAHKLSNELQAEITVEAVYFRPFNTLALKNLQINDRSGNKMLFAENIQANLSFVKLFERKIEIKALQIDNFYSNYEIFKDSTNFSFLSNYFSHPKTDKPTAGKSFQFDLKKFKLSNGHFKVLDHNFNHHNRGIDFSDLELTAVNVDLDQIDLSNGRFLSRINKLSFYEKSGFNLKNLSAKASISNKLMNFEELILQTNRSQLKNQIALVYTGFADFKDFINKVWVESKLKDSYVDSRDIEFFADDMKFVRFHSDIKQADLAGTVAHIRAKNVQLHTAEGTSLHADFTIDGLPYIDKTVFNFSVGHLRTDAADIEQLVPALGNLKSFSLPKELALLGHLNYSGKLSGYYNDFHVDGRLATDLGELSTLSDIKIAKGVAFSGEAVSPVFAIGKLTGTKEIGNAGLNIKFDGSSQAGEAPQLQVQGHALQVDLLDYNYARIDFEGKLAGKTLTAIGTVNDPQAMLSFDGAMDWSTELPTYSLRSDVEWLSLQQTHLFKRDDIVIKETSLEAELQGSSLNRLNGFVKTDKLLFNSSRGEFSIGQLAFESVGDEQSKRLRLSSDVVQAEMAGQINLNSIAAYFQSLAMRYAPAINIETPAYDPQNFDLKIKINSFEPISALFDPDLKLDDGASLKASFSSQNYTANFSASSPILSYKGMQVKNLRLIETADEQSFDLQIHADRMSFSDSVYVDHVHITNSLANDSLNFNIRMSEESRPNHLLLNGNIHFAHNKPAYIKFNHSKIVLNNENWTINQDADLRVSKGKFYLHNLLFKRDLQEVLVNGILSNQDDNLSLAFKEFKLSSFSGLTKPLGITLQGQLNGDIKINSIFKNPNLSAHISTSPIVYNTLPIGVLQVTADYEPNTGLIKLASTLHNIDGRGLTLNGYYDLNKQSDPLQLRARIKETDLLIVQPFLKGLVTNLYGKVDGDLSINGSLQKPIINGSGQLIEASFMVNYLQTSYNINRQVLLIDSNRIQLNNLRFQDSKGTPALCNGFVDLNKLSDPTLNIVANANNLHILNTTRKDNELFFGTAYATGKFSFKGLTSAIDIAIDAESNPNTVITIPFNSSLKVSDNDFIYFSSVDSTQNKVAKAKNQFQGLTMNMDLSIRPEAEINLENNIGSLKGAGRGNLSLRISNLGDFEMFGDYHVLSGKFHFTAQDFFNKYFDLKEGGSIRWAGNPAEAVVNLGASYQQRTSIAPLYNAAGRSENNDRVLAQADMILKGTLSQPEVSFDLNFPQDPYIKDELQSYFSDGNNINQQAVSLIVRRSFTPSSTVEIGRELNNTLLSAGTEIAFNQLNSIISQSLNMNFFDLNIRSFNDASASLKFFDDRLTLTGGVTDRSKNPMNDLSIFSDQVATDAEVTFKLRRDGSLILRAYNRLNTKNFLFTPYSDYISAAGVVYRQEFNSLPEFWRKLWFWNEKKEKKEATKLDSLSKEN